MREANEFLVSDVATAAQVSTQTARRWAKEAGMGQRNDSGHLILSQAEYQTLSQRQKMSSQESGSKGGTATRSRVGPDHYYKIGQRGGERTVDRHGPKFFQALGKRGGDTTRERHGPQHYVEMGKRGGARVREACAAFLLRRDDG